jgi:hypothetical protein
MALIPRNGGACKSLIETPLRNVFLIAPGYRWPFILCTFVARTLLSMSAIMISDFVIVFDGPLGTPLGHANP